MLGAYANSWHRLSVRQPSRKIDSPRVKCSRFRTAVHRRRLGETRFTLGIVAAEAHHSQASGRKARQVVARDGPAGGRVSSFAYFPPPAKSEDVDIRRMKV
ncbi:hypothetical protein SBA4_1750023 [Candidatus Sulfopaludibacter sp. SbA4]|nr:hypothetical protein SBA4_1750023 [Candidatus Sulfopaludibacter sp. SbA4]